MKFKKIKISNLKGVDSLVKEFTGKDLIAGRNETGKTTVINALEYVMTGKIYNSNRVDPYIKNGAEYAEVILYLDTDKPNVIIRRTNKFLTLNGNEVTQEELESKLKFKSLEFLMSIAGNFLDLDEDEKASLLSVSDEKAMAQKLLAPDDLEYIDIDNIPKSIKDLQTKIRDNKKMVEFVSAEIYTLNNQLSTKENELKLLERPSLKEIEEEILKIKTEVGIAVESFEDNKKSLAIDLKVAKDKLAYLIQEEKKTKEQSEKLIMDTEKKNKKILEDKEKAYAKAYTKHLEATKAICPSCGSDISKKFVSKEGATSFKFDDSEFQIIQPRIVVFNTSLIFDTKMLIESLKNDLVKEFDNTYSAKIKELENKISNSDEMFKAKEEDMKKEIVRLKDLIMFKQKGMESSDINRMDYILKVLDKEMPTKIMEEAKTKLLEALPRNYTVSLYEPMKTVDKLKYEFKIFKDGVPYKGLSAGAKIMTNVYLSKYFIKKFGYSTLMVDDINLLDNENKKLIAGVQDYIYVLVQG